MSNKIRFAKNSKNDFNNTLRNRVNQYFEENQIDRYGNKSMYIKTIVMFLLYLVPFVSSFFVLSNPGFYFSLWVLMGLGLAGIGLSVMHDASHGAYSRNKKLNTFLSYSLNWAGGGSVSMWDIQHNKLHHTYTNIYGMDEDISRTKILKFSPHGKKMKMHSYQHYYAWFLYSLMTISWITEKEFKQINEFKEKGHIKGRKKYRKLMTEIIITKVMYYSVTLLLPILLMPYSAWFIALCFLSLHLVAGLILSLIFQPAHVVPTSQFPLPDKNEPLENTWAIHQLLTTSNFSPNNKVFSWFVGGLNYQIEHHLFPGICHVHYKDLSKIVEQTAKDFDLNYHCEKTWFGAIYNHGKILNKFAKMP
ncbi:MAG: acyl-CoA desaturase [Flavobacteriales bacterium]|jgi:linoleoyl-CoA desaturase|nr:acyl-CoA desaturase [Flavobacteriales bacterium]